MHTRRSNRHRPRSHRQATRPSLPVADDQGMAAGGAGVTVLLPVPFHFDLQGCQNHAAGLFSSQLVQRRRHRLFTLLRSLRRSDYRHHRRAFPRSASRCVRVLFTQKGTPPIHLVPQLLTISQSPYEPSVLRSRRSRCRVMTCLDVDLSHTVYPTGPSLQVCASSSPGKAGPFSRFASAHWFRNSRSKALNWFGCSNMGQWPQLCTFLSVPCFTRRISCSHSSTGVTRS